MNMLKKIIFMMLCFTIYLGAESGTLTLRNNLQRANPGDYIVAIQNKTYTLLNIYEKIGDTLTIQEISVPTARIARTGFSWPEWVRKGAPNSTCWMAYTVHTATGKILQSYSYSNNNWYPAQLTDKFLPSLLNLRFTPIGIKDRKKVGSPLSEGGTGGQVLWQPPMIINGRTIPGVKFNAWRAHWPKDLSELSEKVIDVYLPQESEKYPSYFPYWMQVGGVIGSAQLRIVDSGSGLIPPIQPPTGRKMKAEG